MFNYLEKISGIEFDVAPNIQNLATYHTEAKEECCGTLKRPNLWKKNPKSGKFVTYLSHGRSRRY